jgi:threonine synthase
VRFASTAGNASVDTISEAMLAGAAPDGGLFMPDSFPRFQIIDFEGISDLKDVGRVLLAPFFAGDPLEGELGEICAAAFDFPAPLREPKPARPDLWVLELTHGPTAAFKDFGARFLAEVMDRLGDPAHPYLILVATSGDTGGAVGQAFQHAKAARAAILFPKGRVSPFQKRQLSCWGPNVATFEVEADFDACQALVKQAFRDEGMAREFNLSSANSINLGRLLPQAVYYAASSLDVFRKTGAYANYIIPSGNMGNGVACIFARAMGLPIGEIVLAVNANRTLADYFETGQYRPRASIATIANAMDVGDPSNFARFAALGEKAGEVSAISIDDATIRARLAADYKDHGAVWCPHTAVAAEAFARLPEAERGKPWVVVGTADPAKFAEIVEPAIGRTLDLPPALARVMAMECKTTPLRPTLEALRDGLRTAFPASPF